MSLLKKCTFCHKEHYIYSDNGSPNHGRAWNPRNTTVLVVENSNVEFLFSVLKYCPVCGRKLKSKTLREPKHEPKNIIKEKRGDANARKLIYRQHAKKYGDPRAAMLWINGNNRFFLKDGYTIDQVNREQDRKKRKEMIDYSPKRWKEWVKLQRQETKWQIWWKTTHRGPFYKLLGKVLRAPSHGERELAIFKRVMSREEFERFMQSRTCEGSSSTYPANRINGHIPATTSSFSSHRYL